MVPHRANGRAAPCLLLILFVLSAFAPPVWAQTEEGTRQESPPQTAPPAVDPAPDPPLPLPPGQVSVTDTPNDPGDSIDISWQPSPDESNPAAKLVGYAIERGPSVQGPFEQVGQVPLATSSFTDNSVKDKTSYYYRVRSVGLGEGDWQSSEVAGPVRSIGQWFDTKKTPTLIMTFLFCMSVVVLIAAARRGKTFYIRPIPGLSAVDEAIGRATEMGTPDPLRPGLGDLRRRRHPRRLHPPRARGAEDRRVPDAACSSRATTRS